MVRNYVRKSTQHASNENDLVEAISAVRTNRLSYEEETVLLRMFQKSLGGFNPLLHYNK